MAEFQNPSGVTYSSGAIPLATPARSTIRKFYPSTGETYRPEGVKVIRIPLSAEGVFLDAAGHSFLKFQVQHVKASDGQASNSLKQYVMGGGGAHGWIKRMRILSATGQVLEDIDDYNALHSLMIDMQCSPNYCDTVLRSRSGYGRKTTAGSVTADIGQSGNACFLQGTKANVTGFDSFDTRFTQMSQAAAAHANGATAATQAALTEKTANLCLGLGALAGDTPARTVSFIAGNLDDSVADTIGGGTGTGAPVAKTYCLNLMSGLLSQPKYLPLLATKGGLNIELTLEDSNVFMTSKDALGDGVSGSGSTFADSSYAINNVEYVAELVDFGPEFNMRFMQMLQQTGGVLLSGSTYRNHTSQVAPLASQPNISISERSRSIKSIFSFARRQDAYATKQFESIYNRTRDDFIEYQYRVGSLLYPDAPVGMGPENASEGISQAYKALGGALTDVHHGSQMTNESYVKDLGGPSEANQLLTSFDKRGKNVMAMTFESVTQDSSHLESGLNSAAQALPIELRTKCGTSVKSGLRVNSYVLVDAIFSFLPNGEVAASV